ILGLIENMAGLFPGPDAETLAAEAGIPFLGSVPFDRGLSLAGDRGDPFVITEPATPAAPALAVIAAQVRAELERSPRWLRRATAWSAAPLSGRCASRVVRAAAVPSAGGRSTTIRCPPRWRSSSAAPGCSWYGEHGRRTRARGISPGDSS